MDKLIHRHLNARLDMQEDASAAISAALDDVDLNAVIADPSTELTRVVRQALNAISTHIQGAATEGVRFAKEVKRRDQQDRPIMYANSDNPKENAGQL